MKTISSNRASRFSSQDQHNQYGIYNWFVSKGITDKEKIMELCGGFAVEAGFIYDKRISEENNKKRMFSFISNRFKKLTIYALAQS